MSIATVGARYQIVIPAKERKRIGLKPNQKVNVTADRDCIIVEPIGSQSLRGITRELNDGTDAAAYINKLRNEWNTRR
ncbi:AbrB/MazE/SpoVT family DNA-binding domain-containing protein [bacterium]|nr:AbrB/MazE/SpoVT family DNA-binding domain-containing protein [bacterium]